MFFFWFSNYWYFCQISSSSYYFHHSYVFVWNMLHPIVDRNHHTKIGLHQLLFENSNLDLLRYGITVPSWFQIVTDRYWTSAVRVFWPWFLFGTSKFHKQISVWFPFLENMDVFWHLKKKAAEEGALYVHSREPLLGDPMVARYRWTDDCGRIVGDYIKYIGLI